MLTTVIFDMDGLLIDSEPLWGKALSEVLATLNIHLRPGDYRLTTGLRTSEVVDYWYHRFPWKSPSPRKVTEDILTLVTDKILKEGRAMDGIYYILEFFKRKGLKMGLASSSPMQLIISVLNHLDIKGHFAALYSAEHEMYGKPHPAVYLSCASELHSTPLECIVFEDSINGMIAAKAARMKVVAVPERPNRDDPRYCLADMRLNSLRDFTEEKLLALTDAY